MANALNDRSYYSVDFHLKYWSMRKIQKQEYRKKVLDRQSESFFDGYTNK